MGGPTGKPVGPIVTCCGGTHLRDTPSAVQKGRGRLRPAQQEG